MLLLCERRRKVRREHVQELQPKKRAVRAMRGASQGIRSGCKALHRLRAWLARNELRQVDIWSKHLNFEKQAIKVLHEFVIHFVLF